MGILKTKRIVSSNNKSSKVFEALFEETDFLHVDYTSPKEIDIIKGNLVKSDNGNNRK